jgi:uncharacterized protein (TIGR00369 family)
LPAGCPRSSGWSSEGARSFATIELKTNFVGTAREGAIEVEAELVHGGKTTQVWDARVTRAADGRAVALFRCTQLLLYDVAAFGSA